MKTINLSFVIWICIVSSGAAQTLYLPSGSGGIGTSSTSNVGIGLNNPWTKFQIYHAANQAYSNAVYINTDNPNTHWPLVLSTNGKNNHSGFVNSSASDIYLLLRDRDGNVGTQLNSLGHSYLMGGNLGIGIATPNAKLHVVPANSSALKFERADSNVFGFEVGGTIFGLYDYSAAQYKWRTTSGNVFLVEGSGNVGIGTTDPKGYKLAVNGKTITEEVVVKLYGNWPDYVFEPNYNLPSLSELEQYIKTNKHLPEVPTASEVKENGLSLGEMNAILLKKVEELTLHLIEQNKLIVQFQEERRVSADLSEKKVEELKLRLIELEKQIPEIKPVEKK